MILAIAAGVILAHCDHRRVPQPVPGARAGSRHRNHRLVGADRSRALATGA
jgi:hypothetical protein